ncbi:hypothetical protein SEA_BURRO_29 [Microbacterium phage Burro]|uniref:Uncharacterized protein n=1 Tax=Microbacterium phage Burro TaxID=2315703 RepID=A0A386KL70_9CAUD|nr:hypothetical protein HWB89_gp29 [Microbacterium phage Burro]AYD86172.1 hypothetical protein SEA_BURRO_29 [Microbacterium phage Burro]
MVAPVQKDSLTEWQQGLATYLRISSPIAGMFTGSEIKPNPNARSIRVPDIRVDDYITDAEIGRIGTTHYQGSEFTGEWKNGVPPIFWREYSMSRHRSFGFTVFDEQLRYSPIKNIVQEYVGRKMQTTVIRDHDKYCLLAAISGHMTGKLVPRVAGVDTIGPATADAHRISNTGNAADYKWIAEPGEDYDNQIQPSFATVKGMFLDDTDPLKTLDALTLTFSDNWFDSNFGNNERFLLITSALELVFINALIEKGAGTESAFKLYRDGDISGAQANGYLGTLKGSWKLVKIHPEWLPKVFTDASLVVDPVADTSTANRTLRQVVALAAYKNAIQTYEHFSEKRQQDGGVRFKGTEYVQDFSYDAWAIDQLSEGIVPLFMPTSPVNLAIVNTSFTNVAAKVAAARAQKGVSPETYPISGADTVLSRPEWYHQVMGYENTTALNTGLPIQETGDVAHRNPLLPNDDPTPIVLSRANSTAVAVGTKANFTNGQTYVVTVAGTTAAAQPSTTGIDIGETLVDGTATWRRSN